MIHQCVATSNVLVRVFVRREVGRVARHFASLPAWLPRTVGPRLRYGGRALVQHDQGESPHTLQRVMDAVNSAQYWLAKNHGGPSREHGRTEDRTIFTLKHGIASYNVSTPSARCQERRCASAKRIEETPAYSHSRTRARI